MSAAVIRCAIYTRKSSDEGLDQAFNSLDAQREACEAYVRSQVGEGWLALEERYDDGGYSGATMRRPALERMIEDIALGRIDLVIVYKVDRLTRALADFAKMIELFDQHRVSFVSVTQAFNTTNSMSRLTLNVLLSFAQFEREITSERIRDKVAASKAKGMWMGGGVPLGYDPPRDSSRTLIVNPKEADTVQLIFNRYLEVRSFHELALSLDRDGVRSKVYVSANGSVRGGCRLTHGALRHLLRNRVYLGEIVHKGTVYSGRHKAIIGRDLYDQVAQAAGARSYGHRNRVTRAAQTLLNGLLFDSDGQPMRPVFTRGHAGRRYQYYASPAPAEGRRRSIDEIRRVPCHAVDELVRKRVGQLVYGRTGSIWPDELRTIVARVEIHATAVHIAIRPHELERGHESDELLKVVRLGLQPGERLADRRQDGLIYIVLPVRLVVRGGRQSIEGPDGLPATAASIPNTKLVRRLRAGHRVLNDCGIWPIGQTPARDWRGPGSRQRLELALAAFLAPDMQAAILTGRLQRLDVEHLPLWWDDQREALLAIAAPDGDSLSRTEGCAR